MLLILFTLALCSSAGVQGALTRAVGDTYKVGTGIGDITGPAAEVNMMGYANPVQTTRGIHTRIYSRAFIFADSANLQNRFVFVSADIGMMSQIVKLEVVKRLSVSRPGLYSEKNIALSGTHTHSGVAGFLEYFLFQVTSLGFVKDCFEQTVVGIVQSILNAEANMKDANLYLNSGELHNSNINRSPTSYLANPPAERAMYSADTEQIMRLLKIEDTTGKAMGAINWFPVHCTSMNNTNQLISSDNKGYASQMWEREMDRDHPFGSTDFVAAFAQGHEGDVSPNTAGPKCIDSGLPCDMETSTCNGKPTNCIAFGPGRDMVESTKIIGTNQLNKAKELFNTATQAVTGPVKSIHQYVDMSNFTFIDPISGQKVRTCLPAMGYAFAAGTTDGPGLFPFSQGTDTGNPFWDAVRNLLKAPTQDMIACHHPKPILLATGLIDFPYLWHPKIVDTQIIQVGNLVILPVPGEFTTMSGRRLINAVKQVYSNHGQTVEVVVAGLSNEYTHYITTFEEYQKQRYEAASNIYGPYSLNAYIKIYKDLAEALITGTPVPEGPAPPYLLDKMITMLPGVIFDRALSGKYPNADCLIQPMPSYTVGQTVHVEFVGAHPRNSMLQKNMTTFMEVQLKKGTGTGKRSIDDMLKYQRKISEEGPEYYGISDWFKPKKPEGKANDEYSVVFTDAEWETRFRWERESTIKGTSKVFLEWDIPASQAAGTYRICYYGHQKPMFGSVEAISGCSKDFTVRA